MQQIFFACKKEHEFDHPSKRTVEVLPTPSVENTQVRMYKGITISKALQF